jgi:hypothetical protein
MEQINSGVRRPSQSEIKEAAYLHKKTEADKRAAEENARYWDMRSDGRVSLLGRQRYFRNPNKDRDDLLRDFLRYEIFFSSNGPGLLASAIGLLMAMKLKLFQPVFDLSENFKMEAQYASAEIAGTLHHEAQRLMKAFKEPAACEQTLRKKIQEEHGFVFCRNLKDYAVSAKRLNELRDEFDCSHGSHPVLVFREVTQIHRPAPDAPRVSGERAPACVYA